MKRVLIVAPHFAPISAPDGQRARTLAPHFSEFGWQPHILTVDPSFAEAPLEPELSDTIPSDVAVTRVSAISTRFSRSFGLGNIAWRAWNSLRRAGDRLLRQQRFDLVYFSTTQFACLPLGRIWQRRHRVPFVVDLQDPWRNDFALPPGARPPGGWKFRFASAQARLLEPWTLRRCAGVVAVSPAYVEQLRSRYPWWDHARGITLPMGWSERDFAAGERQPGPRPAQPPVIRYIGRLGPDLLSSLEVFLAGFSRAQRSGAPAGIRCEFRGGSYDPRAISGPAHTLANRHGISPFITEDPTRIPYLTALAALRSASANLILGSEDSGYAPSKTWLTLAARRPWLALARPGSVLHALLLPHVGDSGWLIDPGADGAADMVARFCQNIGRFSAGAVDEPQLASMEARELAQRHTHFFAHLLRGA